MIHLVALTVRVDSDSKPLHKHLMPIHQKGGSETAHGERRKGRWDRKAALLAEVSPQGISTKQLSPVTGS
jgi:hypothetical protein